MTTVRRINVSQVRGNNDGVLPAGTIVAYEINGEYVLRVHDGVTEGGVPFPNAPSIVHNNDINLTIDNEDSSTYTWNFGQTGDLTLPVGGDILDSNGDSVLGQLINSTETFTISNNGNVVLSGATGGINRGLVWDYGAEVGGENSTVRQDVNGLTVRAYTTGGGGEEGYSAPVNIIANQGETQKRWTFDGDGDLTLPAGGDILDSEGNSVLGGGNSNVWVETFALTDPEESIVQIATSVEYDANGNIFALFSHSIPGMDNETYTSVAKLSPTGTIVWQVRFSANLNTDGWGLAYDGEDTVYVAGSTAGTPLTYEFATLTKIDAADGTIVWSKTYDFEADSQSAVVDVDSDLDPIMVGYASNGTDNYIITTKVDSADGTVIWSKTLDGQGDDEAYGMAVGPSGEVVAIGYMDQLGVVDGVATLYADSNPNWTGGGLGATSNGVVFSVSVTLGVATFSNISDTTGNRSVDDVIATIFGSIFGGVDGVDDMVVKVATLASNDTDNRMVVVKYNSAGAIQWQKAVQFDANEGCRGSDADIDADGNIYVCGNYDTPIGVSMNLVKFNSSGVKQWSRRVVGDCADFATSVVVGPDNNLYLSGVTSDINAENVRWAVAKYSTTGSVVWQRLIENTASWTFTGGIFFENAGGSNIAVGSDYVALAGGFGTFIIDEAPTATVVQIDTNGTLFSIGDWALTAASFTGSLDNTASDIVVVDAGKTAGTATPAVADFNGGDDDSNFLIGTLYNAPGGNDSLVNGAYSVSLGNTGTVTLPSGGTITEGFVTSNPTIQLTPASPTVASQKLVIKGGSNYNFTDNGITLSYQDNTANNGDSLDFYINGASTYADQTLYWWIYPEAAGLTTPSSGTVTLDGNGGGGPITFTVNNDNFEFTVRVSPEDNNYDPANIGVESGLINPDAPTFDADHHLHLTTGNLAETSIFLGTDDHNVRTTVNGDIEITTPNVSNNVWQFGNDGSLTIPGDIRSENAINIDINLNDSTLFRWQFDTDGSLTFPDDTVQTTAFVQGEQIFTLDTGNTAYAPTAVDFNLLLVTSAIGYSAVTPTSVTLPNGVPGQRLVIFNGYSFATLTVNPGPLGRDISGGVTAEFIYSSIEGWMPLYGTNSPT
jgi:hypothetical protein